MPSGWSVTDLTIPFSDWGVTVTHTARTSSKHPITGDETWTAAAPATFTGIVLRKTTKWIFDKTGELEGGDAYLIAPYGTTITKDDLITADGVTYQVHDVIVRYVQNTKFYSYCNLFIYTGP